MVEAVFGLLDVVGGGGVSDFGGVNRSVIPHFRHLPGLVLVTSGCIGQE